MSVILMYGDNVVEFDIFHIGIFYVDEAVDIEWSYMLISFFIDVDVS